MFIRFVSGETDECSHVAAGLFCAASELRGSYGLPDYECEALDELSQWFDIHLASPFHYLRHERRYEQAVCWFKPTATGHLARARELAEILERNGIFIWIIKSRRIGYVYYEDHVQVFARPYADVRLRL